MRAKQDEDFLEVYHTVLKLSEKRVNKQMITDEEIAAVSNNDLRNWLQDFIAVEIVTEEMIEEIIRSEIEMYNIVPTKKSTCSNLWAVPVLHLE